MTRATPPGLPRYPQAALEIVALVCLCYVFAGSPTPSVNEPHYLGKAKHYWNPTWCEGDFFLNSADAHEVFYWTFGWLTQFFPLPHTAWLGRVLCWTLFALSWRSLCNAVMDVPWGAFLSAVLLLPLTLYADLAGEWLIGGVEAKGFAWPLVIWGVAQACQGKWWLAWPLFGLASSFHILVGGWAVIVTLIAWCWRRQQDGLGWPSLLVWLVVGGTLALPGLIPALQLTASASAEALHEASITYTFRRLSHHLVFYRFSWWNIGCFALLVGGWWFISSKVSATDRLRRLQAVVAASLLIAACGVALDLLLGPVSQGLRARLLRYYWFRMSDILVPMGTAISLIYAWQVHRMYFPRAAQFVGSVLLLCGWMGAMGTVGVAARSTALQQQSWKNVGQEVDVEEIDLAWKDVCQWIRDPDHVPPGSVFLTPTRQQTFKWYAHRADVVTWKDVPQDAVALNAWWDRRVVVDRLGDWPWNDLEKLANIVQHYGVTHVVWPDPLSRPAAGRATFIYRNQLFRVFRLD